MQFGATQWANFREITADFLTFFFTAETNHGFSFSDWGGGGISLLLPTTFLTGAKVPPPLHTLIPSLRLVFHLRILTASLVYTFTTVSHNDELCFTTVSSSNPMHSAERFHRAAKWSPKERYSSPVEGNISRHWVTNYVSENLNASSVDYGRNLLGIRWEITLFDVDKTDKSICVRVNFLKLALVWPYYPWMHSAYTC